MIQDDLPITVEFPSEAPELPELLLRLLLAREQW